MLGVLATKLRQEKQIKGLKIGKEVIKLLLFADDIIVYVESLKESKKKKIPKLINLFSKVARYKINIQKSIAFLYVNNIWKQKLKS